MARHTTFRFCLDPTVEQYEVFARHAGAARLAFNQCLRIVNTAITQRRADPDTEVPWTGFDLINTFNAWKKTGDVGRVFTVDADGVADTTVTGLAWRGQGVSAGVRGSRRRPRSRIEGVVGFAIGQAARQAGRVSAVQEEDRRHRAVSAAQQAPQGQTRRDPDRG